MLFTLLNTLSTKITGIDVNVWGPFFVDKALHYSPIIAEKTIQGIHFTAPFYGYLFYGTLGLTGGLKLAEFAYNYKYIWNKAIEATPGVSHMMWVGKKLSSITSTETAQEITYYPLFNNIMVYTGFPKLFEPKIIIKEIEKTKERVKIQEVEKKVTQIQTVYKTPEVSFHILLERLDSEARQLRIVLSKKETAHIDVREEANSLITFFNSNLPFRENIYLHSPVEFTHVEELSTIELVHKKWPKERFNNTVRGFLQMIQDPEMYLYSDDSDLWETRLHVYFRGKKDYLHVDLLKFQEKFPLISEVLTLSLIKQKGHSRYTEGAILLSIKYDTQPGVFGTYTTQFNLDKWSIKSQSESIEQSFLLVNELVRASTVEIAETSLEKTIQLIKGFMLHEGRTPIDSYISNLPENQQAQIRSLADISLEKVRETYVKFKVDNPNFRETSTIETQTIREDFELLEANEELGLLQQPNIAIYEQGVEETKDSEIPDNMFHLVSSNPMAAFGLLVGAVVIPNFQNIEQLATALLGLSNLPEYREVYIAMSQMRVEDLRDTYNFTQETAERVRNLFDYIQNKPTTDVSQYTITILNKENLMYGGLIFAGAIVIGTTLFYCWPTGSTGIETVKDFEAVILKGLKI